MSTLRFVTWSMKGAIECDGQDKFYVEDQEMGFIPSGERDASK